MDASGKAVTLTKVSDTKYTFFMPASKATFAEVAPVNLFTGVYSCDYCDDAVLWAVENGITTGVTPTAFCPNVTVSRVQAVAFLYREQA